MTLFILDKVEPKKRQLAGSVLLRPSAHSVSVPGESSDPQSRCPNAKGELSTASEMNLSTTAVGLGSKASDLPPATSRLKECWQQSHHFPCKVDTAYYAGSLCAAVTDEQVNDEEQEM